jgi:hypothetical protein
LGARRIDAPRCAVRAHAQRPDQIRELSHQVGSGGGGARTCGVIASLRYVVNHTGAWKDSGVQTPNSSLSVRPVVALAWVMARSSALFFGCEKPCAVPL